MTGVAVAAVAFAAALVGGLVLSPETIDAAMRESGPIENATIVAYVVAMYVAWRVDNADFDGGSRAAITLFLFACVAKELSLRQPMLLNAGYPSTTFDMSAWPNIAAAVVYGGLLPATLWLVFRHGRKALDAVARRTAPVGSFGAAFVCVTASQLLDYAAKGDGRHIGLALSGRALAIMLALEEVLELVFPLLVLLALLQIGRRAPRARR